MMIVREILLKERDEYNNVVSHILQTYEWGQFREATGVKIFRFGEFDGKLTSGYQLTFHPFPHTSYSIGYFPRGLELDDELFDHLLKIGQENNSAFIKIEADISDKQYVIHNKNSNNIIPSTPILPRFTFHVDLTASEDEILGRLKEKTRYNIRLAQKSGIEVFEKDDFESLEIFIKLINETGKRQGFYNHPADYYRTLWSILKPAKMCYLFLAYYDKAPIAGIMLFRFKNMLYYPYGGSSLLYREKMPNHLLHFEAIKFGKKIGCTTYDMWGAYKNSPSEKDPWFGIYRFKEGFGGKLVEYPETVDLVFNPTYYKIYRFIDPLRFKLLFLKRLIKL